MMKRAMLLSHRFVDNMRHTAVGNVMNVTINIADHSNMTTDPFNGSGSIFGQFHDVTDTVLSANDEQTCQEVLDDGLRAKTNSDGDDTSTANSGANMASARSTPSRNSATVTMMTNICQPLLATAASVFWRFSRLFDAIRGVWLI